MRHRRINDKGVPSDNNSNIPETQQCLRCDRKAVEPEHPGPLCHLHIPDEVADTAATDGGEALNTGPKGESRVSEEAQTCWVAVVFCGKRIKSHMNRNRNPTACGR